MTAKRIRITHNCRCLLVGIQGTRNAMTNLMKKTLQKEVAEMSVRCSEISNAHDGDVARMLAQAALLLARIDLAMMGAK